MYIKLVINDIDKEIICAEEEAQKTLEAFKELEELEEAYFAGKAAHS